MTLYFLECDFGRHGRAFVETARESSYFERVVSDIISGEVERVVTVLEVDEDEGYCRDITEDVARTVRERLVDRGEGCPRHLRAWIDDQLGPSTADEIDAICEGREEVVW